MLGLFLLYDHSRCGGGRFCVLPVADPENGEDDQQDDHRRDQEETREKAITA